MSAKANTKPQPTGGANTKAKAAPAAVRPLPAAPPASSIFGMLDDIKGLDNSPTSAAIADLIPDATQDRKHFDETELENLAESIRAVGVLLPILVSPTGGMPPWKIVDGERRWRASQLAGVEEVPIKVREDLVESNDVRHLAQLIANANKTDLLDYEMAKAIQRELDKMGNKHGDKGRLAKLLNRPAAAISRYLNMLDPQFEQLVRDGVIVSATDLARFKSLEPELRDQLLAELPPGKPLTETMIREATRKADPSPDAAGTREVPPAPETTGDSASSAVANAAAGDGLAQAAQSLADGTGLVTPEAEGANPAASTASPGASDEAPGANGSEAGHNGDTQGLEGNGDGNDGDGDDDDQRSGAGTSGPAASSNTGAAGGSARGTGATREKAVQLATTAERVEHLLRYFVDKATDRVELRVPADLAIAIIENLGGEIPDDRDQYATRIMDLLQDKLG
jgi:ParB/RepB/Spo0J family partition protein